ncbi:hypothetical protein MM213_04545 [Belliella sp. R4-6]|uniref:Uncharacterized protein n=1 Tax=Belliella alkalica TaxID=1730871 RepID=A0ABS9V8K3_9BACT|nr:hypothetical protein [Belliella alkalica]MCH7412743.1 hypothetical protein [Belliella alkalica]
MKKKNRLAKAVMVASVMTMGVGLIHSFNLEAQTTGGGEGGDCWNGISEMPGVQTRFCGSCTFVDNSKPSAWAKKKEC